jgi:hypothetical protein
MGTRCQVLKLIWYTENYKQISRHKIIMIINHRVRIALPCLALPCRSVKIFDTALFLIKKAERK